MEMTYLGDWCRFSEYGKQGIVGAIDKLMPSLASTVAQYGMPSEMKFHYSTDDDPVWDGIPFAERYETVAWKVGYPGMGYNAEEDKTVYCKGG